ncbi:MAG: hypothetical protein RLZZ22_1303 [Pseudomonadota bacterium]|jgi:DNA-binding MarR family transcriptional regulator
MESTRPRPVQLDAQPGHAIRRLHQISVGIFHQETEALNITPVQYAILQTVRDLPGCDQRTLAGRIALDTSTTAGVVDRLEARGLLQRRVSPEDRRVRLLALTPAGELLLAQTLAGMERTQERILEPLSPEQRLQFMALLRQLVTENNDLSRAPSESAR